MFNSIKICFELVDVYNLLSTNNNNFCMRNTLQLQQVLLPDHIRNKSRERFWINNLKMNLKHTI